MPLTDRIKTKAANAKHTFASIERELGFAQGSIRKWDTSIPSSDKLLRVAQFLGVTTDWLLTGEGDLTPISVTPADMTEELLLEEYRAADKQKRKAILQAALGTNHEPKGEPYEQ